MSRESEIAAKDAAIRARLKATNSSNKTAALKKIDPKKGGVRRYTTQSIAGADKGYTKTDYGVGNEGAGIPYRILENKNTMAVKQPSKKKPPKIIPKPTKPSGGGGSSSSKGHSVYKVRAGESLSGIAKKHGTDWRTIWNYNLKNRSKKTQAALRKSGPNRIYRGGSFYIPNK